MSNNTSHFKININRYQRHFTLFTILDRKSKWRKIWHESKKVWNFIEFESVFLPFFPFHNVEGVQKKVDRHFASYLKYYIRYTMKRENTGRKTDTNSMKCQTFFDSCQIFHHFDFLSNLENNVKFSWYILMYSYKCEVFIGHV